MGFLERHYKGLIIMLAVLLAVGYWHKFYGDHKGKELFEYGFYSWEKWDSEKMRWTWKEACECLEPSADLLGIKVVASDLNSNGPEGLAVDFLLNGESLGRTSFFGRGSRYLYYYLNGLSAKAQQLCMKVSRTWNPRRLGINQDPRDLGVAVSPVFYLKIMPRDGVGFYRWENVDAQSAERIAQRSEIRSQKSEALGRRDEVTDNFRFRWTGKRASIPVAESSKLKAQRSKVKAERSKVEAESEVVVFLRCSHPDVGEKPVRVKVFGDGAILRYVEFRDHDWKRVAIGAEELEGKKMLTFEVSRTWNPKRMGVSEDGRDLGVAVATNWWKKGKRG